MIDYIKNFFSNLLYYFFECSYCNKNYIPKNLSNSICENCWKKVIEIIPYKHKYKGKFYLVYSLGKYNGLLQFIAKSKYRKNPQLYFDVAEKMSFYWKKYNLDAEYLIYVPQHPIRRFERWFNHSEEIAKVISKKINIKIFNKIKYKKYKKAQTRLSIKERAEKTKNIFYISDIDKEQLKDKKVCLIDDIYTTGATISALLELISTCEVKSCFIFVVARSNL